MVFPAEQQFLVEAFIASYNLSQLISLSPSLSLFFYSYIYRYTFLCGSVVDVQKARGVPKASQKPSGRLISVPGLEDNFRAPLDQAHYRPNWLELVGESCKQFGKPSAPTTEKAVSKVKGLGDKGLGYRGIGYRVSGIGYRV